MQKKFSYGRKLPEGSFWFLLTATVIFIALAGWVYFNESAIRYKNLILESVHFLYLSGFAWILSVFSYFSRQKQKKLFEKIGTTYIVMHEDFFEFIDDEGIERKFDYKQARELWIRENPDDDVCEVIVYYPILWTEKLGERFAFKKVNFENANYYFEFHDILSEKCINIQNRDK